MFFFCFAVSKTSCWFPAKLKGNCPFGVLGYSSCFIADTYIHLVSASKSLLQVFLASESPAFSFVNELSLRSVSFVTSWVCFRVIPFFYIIFFVFTHRFHSYCSCIILQRNKNLGECTNHKRTKMAVCCFSNVCSSVCMFFISTTAFETFPCMVFDVWILLWFSTTKQSFILVLFLHIPCLTSYYMHLFDVKFWMYHIHACCIMRSKTRLTGDWLR